MKDADPGKEKRHHVELSADESGEALWFGPVLNRNLLDQRTGQYTGSVTLDQCRQSALAPMFGYSDSDLIEWSRHRSRTLKRSPL